MDKIFNIIKIFNDNAGIISVALIIIVGIIENSKKIALNPLSKFFTWLSKITNKELIEEIKNVKKDIKSVKKDIQDFKDTEEQRHKTALKCQISDFATDLKNGLPKEETQFIAIMEQTTEYLDKGWNSKIQLDAIYIKKEYEKRYF